MKKMLSVALSLILLLSFVSAAFADVDDETYHSAGEVIDLILDVRSKAKAPISLVKATLNSGGRSSPVYLMALDGTLYVPVSVNNPFACVLSSFDLSTIYLREAKRILLERVPVGSKLLLAGHSLGGMIAQQLASDKTIKSRYEIVNTLTAGAPVVLTGASEGSIHRLTAKNDIIPKLGIGYILKGSSLFSIEKTADSLNPMNAHMSYHTDPAWNAYDVLGVKGGQSTLTLNRAEVKAFCEVKIELVRRFM